MLLAAWALTSPTNPRPKLSQFGFSATAAASSPPIMPEVAVIVNTAARVMINHLLTTSICLPADRLAVSITSFQFASRDIFAPKGLIAQGESNALGLPCKGTCGAAGCMLDSPPPRGPASGRPGPGTEARHPRNMVGGPRVCRRSGAPGVG